MITVSQNTDEREVIRIKRIILFIAAAAAVFAFSVEVYAASDENDLSEVYKSQFEAADISSLLSGLPEETRESLASAGIGLDTDSTPQLPDTGRLLSQAAEMLASGSRTPLCGFTVCFGIIILCSMTEGFGIGASEKRLQTVQNTAATMCICAAVIVPLCATIQRASQVISGAAGFMLIYAPVMAGLLSGSGHTSGAASYYTAMLTAGNAVSLLSSRLIIPMMNVFLALSVTSSVSPKMQLGSLCETVYKTAKWALTLVMSVFITVLSLNSIITSSMDSVTKRVLRFTVSSFTPVVGGVLSEALSAFNGSLELLRSGAGVFVIIASAFILLPVLFESIVWQLSLFALAAVADISGISRIACVFRTVSKAAAMLTALLLCTLTVFVISTVIVLLAYRGQG